MNLLILTYLGPIYPSISFLAQLELPDLTPRVFVPGFFSWSLSVNVTNVSGQHTCHILDYELNVMTKTFV